MDLLNITFDSQWNASTRHGINVTSQLTHNNVTQLPTLRDLLEEKLGPRHKNTAEVTVLLVIYSLVFISGTVGNVCTCIVILRNNYMRTTTNYYLLSLAISDVLILLIGLPPEAYSIWEAYPWRFGREFCFIKTYSAEVTSYASVLTITAFTVERYIAICRPLKFHKIVPTVRCIRIIVAIWIISICCALPFPLHTELFYYVNDVNGKPIPDSLQCNIPAKYYNQMIHMFQMSTFVFFVIPLTVIIVLYTLIGLTLRRAELHRRTSDEYSSQGKHRQSGGTTVERGVVHIPRKSVLRVLVAVVVAFFVCWAPFHAQRLFTVFNKHWTPFLFDLQSTLFYISGVLYFVGSTVNPILYNVMSRRYRLAFMHTICNAREHQLHYSSYRLNNDSVLYFVGSTVNPILYNVMSRRYRLAFMHTICNAREHQRHYSSYRLNIDVVLSMTQRVLYFVGSTVNPILYNVMSRRYRLAFMHTICNAREHQRHYSSYRLTTGGNSCRTPSEKRTFRGTHTVDDKTYDVLLRYSSNCSFDRNRLLNAEKKHMSKCAGFSTSETSCNGVTPVTGNTYSKTNGHVGPVEAETSIQGNGIAIDEQKPLCRRCSILGNKSDRRESYKNDRRESYKSDRRESYKRMRSLSNGTCEYSQGCTEMLVVSDRGMIENDVGEFV